MTVHEFFTLCEKEMQGKCTPLRRTSFALRRAGVNTMEMLCEMRAQAPEKLADIRDIGPQSIAIVDEVVRLFEQENSGHGEKLLKIKQQVIGGF